MVDSWFYIYIYILKLLLFYKIKIIIKSDNK